MEWNIFGIQFICFILDPTEFVKVSGEQTARVGHDVKIKCKVSGVPTVKITWDFNGKPLGE